MESRSSETVAHSLDPIRLVPADEAELEARRREREATKLRPFRKESTTFEQLSTLVGCLRQIELDGLPKYRYASAGGLYPVQPYVVVRRGGVTGLEPGAYYYHPRDHKLALLDPDGSLEIAHFPEAAKPYFDDSAFAVFLVAQMNAIRPMYGGLSRDFCLIESGLISQLLETEAPASELLVCQVEDFDFDPVRHWFDLDDGHEFMHAMLVGRHPGLEGS